MFTLIFSIAINVVSLLGIPGIIFQCILEIQVLLDCQHDFACRFQQKIYVIFGKFMFHVFRKIIGTPSLEKCVFTFKKNDD